MYMWCTFPGLAKKGQYFLIDTGAMISIIPLKTYEEMAPEFRTQLMQTKQKIKAGNNTNCDVRGTAICQLTIANQDMKHKYYVCADASCPIIGLDFLRKFKMTVDPVKNVLRCVGGWYTATLTECQEAVMEMDVSVSS